MSIAPQCAFSRNIGPWDPQISNFADSIDACARRSRRPPLISIRFTAAGVYREFSSRHVEGPRPMWALITYQDELFDVDDATQVRAPLTLHRSPPRLQLHRLSHRPQCQWKHPNRRRPRQVQKRNPTKGITSRRIRRRTTASTSAMRIP